ncbi:vanadium-dependent haloperoxidase [Flavobacteriaceae bacterium HL-DH10]|uniref:Vanadium-dependent haloperoxidase n=2 Tax=Thalassobellus suaedae TaxID=3074124 RepID=A0ABY9XYN5_9FLAO|nr:vanadium-dependent haloperoxidase [Flavobacteriaceae bacterium HL-DH10]
MKFTPLLIIIMFWGCKNDDESIVITPDNYHNSIDQIISVMIHDIFSPPVASRIFAYPNVAAYEIIASNNKDFKSISGQLSGLTAIPNYDKSKGPLNVQLASLVAYIDVSNELIFSEEPIVKYRDSLYTNWKSINKVEFNNAKEYGLKVADHIKKWLSKDNYKETRSMPKYTIKTNDPSKWQPTPPAYMDGIEPHWSKIRTFVIDSANQFAPPPPPKFSLEKGSLFYKELKEVYDVGNEIVKKGDTCVGIKTARFWDCNPYVSVTHGHMMYAVKKITPGAHWIGITKIACRKTNYNFDQTVYAYTKTALAIADGFISCWDEKYRSNLVRPETLINKYIDQNWKPLLQTPPFPEYSSGHSVVSGAAAVVLTDIFGDNFKFDDNTEMQFGLPIRSFNSFNEAANEAAMSRMYGGIHYRAAIEKGVQQGRNLGAYVVKKLKMK